MQNQEKYGVVETLEVVDAMVQIRQGWLDAKEDDGRVSRAETITIVVRSFPSVVKAAQGIGEIPNELGDLSDEELQTLKKEGYANLIGNSHISDAIFHLSKAGQAIDSYIKEQRAEKVVETLLEAKPKLESEEEIVS